MLLARPPCSFVPPALHPIVFAYRVESTWSAVLLIGLAAAVSIKDFPPISIRLTSDMFPAGAVGSVVGNRRHGPARSGGLFIAAIVGHVLQWTGSYKVSIPYCRPPPIWWLSP